MLYLLDANVLIEAKNSYFEFGRVDQYWNWLVCQAVRDNVKIPIEIFEEICRKQDQLSNWAMQHKSDLILAEEVNPLLVQKVVTDGYAPDLDEVEIENIGRDPFLIAYALYDVENRTVVTTEVRTNKIRQNKKVPNVCDDLGINCCNQFQILRILDFRTI